MTPRTRGAARDVGRRELGLTGPEFAALFGVSPTTVSRWENGWNEPIGSTRVFVDALARLLRTTGDAECKRRFGRALRRSITPLRMILNTKNLRRFAR